MAQTATEHREGDNHCPCQPCDDYWTRGIGVHPDDVDGRNAMLEAAQSL